MIDESSFKSTNTLQSQWLEGHSTVLVDLNEFSSIF